MLAREMHGHKVSSNRTGEKLPVHAWQCASRGMRVRPFAAACGLQLGGMAVSGILPHRDLTFVVVGKPGRFRGPSYGRQIFQTFNGICPSTLTTGFFFLFFLFSGGTGSDVGHPWTVGE